jgi:hypothetical protein
MLSEEIERRAILLVLQDEKIISEGESEKEIIQKHNKNRTEKQYIKQNRKCSNVHTMSITGYFVSYFL